MKVRLKLIIVDDDGSEICNVSSSRDVGQLKRPWELTKLFGGIWQNFLTLLIQENLIAPSSF